MTKKRTNLEFVVVRADGTFTDAPLHEAILDNPEADRALSRRAISRAMTDGLSFAEAKGLYGLSWD